MASIQIELSDSVLNRFRDDLLEFIRQTQATAVIMDFSGLEVMDAVEFEAIHQILDMVKIMGARVVVAGLRAGVVSSLVDLGVDTEGIDTAMNLDDAFDKLFDPDDFSSDRAQAGLIMDDAEAEIKDRATQDDIGFDASLNTF